ncbi:DUF2855 family protein [Mycolicibacterium baixiangningiae]|uniref:DUF2855 family protein n=1 Tax=Mycolicibacterium baixiangningiae TaxID=2761578 RepID=UPI0018D0B5F0|nr:DUF2855 family protein [Mycolicibacterium baixiangningiae]
MGSGQGESGPADVSESSVLEVHRDSPFDGFVTVQEPLPTGLTGNALLAVERFSLAANNLTYVLVNDVLRTLDAFPSPKPDRGRVPVWGIAEVIAADPSVATVGTRVAGFLPMATHADVRLTSTETGLLSIDAQRVGMLPIYRRLTPVVNDPRSIDADIETVLLAVHPFAALLAADVTATGARTVVVSSASSRSAAALSRLLTRAGVDVIGLTSSRHRPVAQSLAVYAQVLGYDEVDQIRDGSVYVDVAGSAEVTTAVHDRLGSRLVESIAVGGTHLRSLPSTPGPALTRFNTGDREVDMVRERGWQAVQAMYDDARADLTAWATRWLRITTVNGLTATEPVWRDIVAGRSDPLSAVVIRP